MNKIKVFYNLLILSILSTFDVLSTMCGLTLGATEINPVANFLIEQMGFTGLFVGKIVSLLIVIPLSYTLEEVNIHKTLFVMNSFLFLVVVSNLVQLYWMVGG